jgi:hypothetical protein
VRKPKDMAKYVEQSVAVESTAWTSSEPMRVTAPSPVPFGAYLAVVILVGVVVGLMVSSIGGEG